MAYKLYTPKSNPRGLAAQIVAEYAGVQLTVINSDEAPSSWATSPLSAVDTELSKWPVLQIDEEQPLWGGSAIARYLARENPDSWLFGDGSEYQAGQVEQWISFCGDEIILPGSSWVFAAKGHVQLPPQTIEQAQKHLKKTLAVLNNHLLSRTFLVGERVSLADIVVATSLYELYTFAFDARFRAPFVNTNRWFTTLVNQPEFLKVLGATKYAEKAPTVENKAPQATKQTNEKQQQQQQKQQQQQPKQQQQQGQPREGKKKEKKEKKDRQKGRREPEEKKVELNDFYGVLPLNCSQSRAGKTFVKVQDIKPSLVGQTIWVKARVTPKGVGNICFLILRQRFSTVQAILTKGGDVTNPFLKFAQKIPRESIVQVEGVVSNATVESVTQKGVEIQVKRLFVESLATVLPLLVEDAARPQTLLDQQAKEIEAIEKELATETDPEKIADLTKRKSSAMRYVDVSLQTRLDNRIIDLRTPANQAIYKIQSGVGELFRRYLLSQGFVEIHTPKMIGAASEGGANVFKLKYFDGTAYLAQSPQLYKQMAICGDLERVFEIGPVFRAENSHTHRHLTEFIGLDLEMAIYEHYHEVLDVLGELFIAIFEGLEKEYAAELEAVREQYPFEPFKFLKPTLRLTYPEGVAMLKEAGFEQSVHEDLSTPAEKLLGRLVKEKYHTDFYILEKYPESARPFYTMLDPEDPQFTNSYDFFIRGEEIMSGSQRIHDAELLERRAREKGVAIPTIQPYIDAFKYGAPPHGGGGVGLERVVMLYLGLNDIRKTSLFPRDPSRIVP